MCRELYIPPCRESIYNLHVRIEALLRERNSAQGGKTAERCVEGEFVISEDGWHYFVIRNVLALNEH